MEKKLEYKFRKIEYWPDDNGGDNDGMLFCIQYATKGLEYYAVFAIPISKEQFSNVQNRLNLEKEYGNLELIECAKKILKNYPDLTQDVLEQIPQSIFGTKEKMMGVFETIKGNKHQIMIARYVIEERSRGKNRASRDCYIDMLTDYNNHVY